MGSPRAAIGAALGLLLIASPTSARPDIQPPSILQKMERAADWELAHLDQADVPPSMDAKLPRGWIRATFYVGLASLADRSRNPKYADAIFALGEREKWQLGPRHFHA